VKNQTALSYNTQIVKQTGDMMKRILIAGLASVVSMAAMAQTGSEEEGRVVLPLEAQQCRLPSAPPPIPDNPVKDELIKAQKNVRNFQQAMVVYRECLDKDSDSPDLTWGNQQAISNAHDYSVDMEERVAAIFNEALRAYKAAQAGN
jgi:hypothetical protein